MATLAQTRTRVDTWLTARWPIVTSRQQTYFNNHGRYFQGMISHTFIPNHTNAQDNDIIADRLSLHPSDQLASWIDALPELDGILFPAALVCDVYSSPQGQGYVVSIFVRYNGTLYSRSQSVGLETHWTKPWHIEEEI